MKLTFRALGPGLAAIVVVGAAIAAGPQVHHPAVTPYTGSTLTRRDNDGHRSYNIVVAVDPSATAGQDGLKTIKVEGNLIRQALENPRNRSAAELFDNYRAALEAAGFDILFACAGAECAPNKASSRWNQVTGLKYTSPDMRYLAAKSKSDGTIYAAILVAKNRHQIEILESTPMQTGMVTAKVIGEGLKLDGRIVLDGIFFDTDRTDIRPESKPALAEIAAYLQENETVNAFVVGHTDGAGTFDHNMALSKGRASAVVQALVRDYAVAPGRLIPHGVGPLSPQRANLNEGGRTQNRRVELVQR